MFRFIVLVAATLAVANTQTYLYPSSIRQVSLPTQSQYSLGSYSLNPTVPYSNLYTAVYRYPLQVPYQRQYYQTTPLYTQSQVLPVVWSRHGRSYGDVSSVEHSAVGQQQYVGQQGAVASAAYPVSSGFVGVHPYSSGYQQSNAGYQRPSSGYQQPSSGYQQPGSGYQQSGPSHQQPSSGYQQPNSGYQQPSSGYQQPGSSHQQQGSGYQRPSSGYPQSSSGYQQHGSGYQHSVSAYQHPAGVYQSSPAIVGFIPASAIIDPSRFSHEQVPVSGYQQSAPIAAGPIPQSYPVTYSVEFPRAYTQSPQLASTAQVSQIPISQGTPVVVGSHQESTGHHQVSHVSIPGQVGVGGGYTSAAFYETAPAGVVIPSVPLSSEPIVASDVKVASKGSVEPVQSQATHGQHPHHQGVGVQQTY